MEAAANRRSALVDFKRVNLLEFMNFKRVAKHLGDKPIHNHIGLIDDQMVLDLFFSRAAGAAGFTLVGKCHYCPLRMNSIVIENVMLVPVANTHQTRICDGIVKLVEPTGIDAAVNKASCTPTGV